MADLPTALWWVPPAAPPLAGAVFDDLAGMAGQVIYDSGAWQEAETGVMAVVAWLGRRRECRLADLGWRRLKPWRRVIAETVDPLLLPGALSSLRTVTVDYAGATALQAYLLIGWLASRLDWQCVRGLSGAAAEAACTFATASGSVRVLARRLEDREPGLQRVALAWEEARQARSATVAWHGHDRLLVNVEGDAAAARVLPVQRKPRAALVARQLADLHGDAVFLDSLTRTRRRSAVQRPNASCGRPLTPWPGAAVFLSLSPAAEPPDASTGFSPVRGVAGACRGHTSSFSGETNGPCRQAARNPTFGWRKRRCCSRWPSTRDVCIVSWRNASTRTPSPTSISKPSLPHLASRRTEVRRRSTSSCSASGRTGTPLPCFRVRQLSTSAGVGWWPTA
jgi:glucose-6-phosphate dehydrogenase assembly protein OpcA